IRAADVTGIAIAEVAREPDFLVIGSPQHVRIGQVFAAVDAVDLPGEVHALTRGAIRQGRIVADGALLGSVASAAVDEAQIHMAGRALRCGHYLAPRDGRALVYREIVLDGKGGVGGRSGDHRARKQRDRIASLDGNREGAHRGGRDLIGHGVDVNTIAAHRLAGVFGNADCARTCLVVGVGAAQNHPYGGDLADVDRHAGLIHHAERYRGRVPWSGVIDLDYLGHQSRKRCGVVGDNVPAGDRGIQIRDGVGAVAVLALVVVRLRQIDMVHTGGEVHVIVAGTARRGAGIGLPVVGLGGLLRMTGGAIADVLGKNDGGEVRPLTAMPDPVGGTGLDAGQARSHVDLVDQYLHILGEPGIRIDGLRLVAHDAQFHGEARSAVADQWVVALVAGIGRDHRARHLY